METIYSIGALSTGTGRDGHIRTDDAMLDLAMRAPKQLGGSGDGVNPEQFFAAGYAACFHSALQVVGRKHKVTLTDSTVRAVVALVCPEPEIYQLAVKLTVSIPSLSHELASQLADEAHQICPYSNATRGNIEVTVDVVDESTAQAALSPSLS